jgi:inorganic pyrophosphatase
VYINIRRGKHSPYKVKEKEGVLAIKQVSKSELQLAKNFSNRK